MSEVLSQGEVDALLRGVGDGEIDTETDEAAEEVSGIVTYDLTSQEKIIRGRLPTLDIINQMFSRLFRNTFSGLMRKPVDVRTVSTDTIKFGDILRCRKQTCFRGSRYFFWWNWGQGGKSNRPGF